MIHDDRIILLPHYFDSCPKYWQNFVASIIHDAPDLLSTTLSDLLSTTLFSDYNVIEYSIINHISSNAIIDMVRKIEFATREDLVYFQLKWS